MTTKKPVSVQCHSTLPQWELSEPTQAGLQLPRFTNLSSGRVRVQRVEQVVDSGRQNYAGHGKYCVFFASYPRTTNCAEYFSLCHAGAVHWCGTAGSSIDNRSSLAIPAAPIELRAFAAKSPHDPPFVRSERVSIYMFGGPHSPFFFSAPVSDGLRQVGARLE
jgi:hypothetical protein